MCVCETCLLWLEFISAIEVPSISWSTVVSVTARMWGHSWPITRVSASWQSLKPMIRSFKVGMCPIYCNLSKSIYLYTYTYIHNTYTYIYTYIYYIHVYIYMYVMILICDTDCFKCRKPSKSIQSGSKSGSAIGCRGTNGVGTSQAGGIHQALGWICGSNFLYTMYNCIQL